MKHDLLRLHGRNGSHITYEPAHAFAFIDDNLKMGISLFGVLTRQIADHLRIGTNHGQRRLKVMRNVGNQILLTSVRISEFVCSCVEGFRQVVYL